MNRIPDRVRTLSAEELAIPLPAEVPDRLVTEAEEDLVPLDTSLPDDDPVLLRVRELLDDFGGVILRGPPGTSKSYLAFRVAAKLVDGDPARVRVVQFHPSYQYEDFVEGFVPDVSTGTFKRKRKHFLRACEMARRHGEARCVLIVDELSRADPARVFGEALTYMERSKRDIEFRLSSGRLCAVPDNLVIVATMNEQDRGVDEVDAALERRFGMISLEPSAQRLDEILTQNGVEPELRRELSELFRRLQQHQTPGVRIGHAYFTSVRDLPGLRRLWENQLRFVLQRAFPLDDQGFERLKKDWQDSLERLEAQSLQPAQSEPNSGVEQAQ